jgi:hypothetical protein
MAILAQNPHLRFSPTCTRTPKRSGRAQSPAPTEPPPLELPVEPDELEELDEIDLSCPDDAHWEVFIADDDCEPFPEPGDFWNGEFPNDE